MNYIKEINAFYDLQDQMPLSGAAVSLCYALMHINNKTRWKNTFRSPGSVLRNKAGLTESSFNRSRAQFVEHGYIEIQSRGRGKAPIYTMFSLLKELERDEVVFDEREDQHSEIVAEELEQVQVPVLNDEGEGLVSATGHEKLYGNQHVSFSLDESLNQPSTEQVDLLLTHVPDQLVDHLPDQHTTQVPGSLIKQYINKTNASAAGNMHVGDFSMNQSTNEPQPILFYQENFGKAGPFVMQSLLDWINSLGEELVIEAMKRALERNKTSWSYVKSILNDWYKKGIRIVSQAQAEQVAF